MRRFDYDDSDNEEFREDVDKFFQDNAMFFEDEDEEFRDSIDFVSRDLNLRCLRTCIRMLEKSFWWKFLSLSTRLKQINKAYKRLKTIQDE